MLPFIQNLPHIHQSCGEGPLHIHQKSGDVWVVRWTAASLPQPPKENTETATLHDTMTHLVDILDFFSAPGRGRGNTGRQGGGGVGFFYWKSHEGGGVHVRNGYHLSFWRFLLYRSRPDLDQYAQGIVHNIEMVCYRVKMLPTEQGEFAMFFFSVQDGWSPARSVFLSPYSRARCNVRSKVLAIAHATMTLLLVAPLRLSLKDKRKETIPLQAVKIEDAKSSNANSDKQPFAC